MLRFDYLAVPFWGYTVQKVRYGKVVDFIHFDMQVPLVVNGIDYGDVQVRVYAPPGYTLTQEDIQAIDELLNNKD